MSKNYAFQSVLIALSAYAQLDLWISIQHVHHTIYNGEDSGYATLNTPEITPQMIVILFYIKLNLVYIWNRITLKCPLWNDSY